MNASAFSDLTPTPTLADDDVALAMYANAIDKIDGLHRGPGHRKPRRIPLNSRRWEHDESCALNIVCDIKPNQEPHLKSSSASSSSTTTTTTSSYTGHCNSSVTSFDSSSSSTLADDMLVDHPGSSPTSTSMTPHAEPPVDGGVPVGLSLETSSHSSFTSTVNSGDGDNDDDGDASLDPTDFPNAPRRKKRARGRFRGQLNDIEPRSSPRRRYKSPNRNLRSVLHEIQVGIDCISSDDEYEPAALPPSKLRHACPEQQHQEHPAMSNKINLLTKPLPQQEQSAASMPTETSREGDNEDCRCLNERYEQLNVHESTTNNFISAFSNDKVRRAQDASGWAALMSLFMT